MSEQSFVVPARDRVRDHTPRKVNARIDTLTRASIDACVTEGTGAIQHRLAELDAEWDIDRALFVNFAVAGGVALSLGLRRYAKSSPFGARRTGFLYFLGAQLGFLFLHGVAGWCPPVTVFRRLGFRTRSEIEAERYALLRASPTTA